MEKSTVIGLSAGIASIGIGMYLKGADPHALINPAAFLIIFAGTAAALFHAFTMEALKRFPVLCQIIFCGKPHMSTQSHSGTIMDKKGS